MKYLVTILLLAATSFAVDAPKPTAPVLTGDQKAAAYKLQLKAIQLQEAEKALQDEFAKMSAMSCGPTAQLTFVADTKGGTDPVCQVTPAKEEKK